MHMPKQPVMSLTKRFTFDSAHFLPGYQGKCSQLHGHTYQLEITVAANVDEETGMIIDFTHIKRLVEEEVLEELDHKNLNDVIRKPTAENTVIWIRNKLLKKIEQEGVSLKRIRLWETPSSYVTMEL